MDVVLGIHAIINPSVFSFATPAMRVYAGMLIGFAVLSDLITTFYLSKSFYDMKSTSERSVGFLIPMLVLLTIIFLSTS
jgi:polyferredoxin